MDPKACQKAVSNLLEWKLKLLESSQNVHHLLWTSQPTKPDDEPASPYKIDTPFQVNGCLKDVSFNDLQPAILQAAIVPGGVDVKKHVKLEVEQLPKDTQPTKHEENVKLIVDATQMPKGTKSLSVIISYEIPEQFERYASFNLPVKDPTVPDVTTETPQVTTETPQVPTEKPQVTTEKPQLTTEVPDQPDEKKSGGLGAGIWIILVILLLGLGVGAFLYRRHLRMQAHAREVPP